MIFSRSACTFVSSFWTNTRNGHTNTHAKDQIHYFISRKSWSIPKQNHVTHFLHLQNFAGFIQFSALLWPLRRSVSHFSRRMILAQSCCRFDFSWILSFLRFLFILGGWLDLRDPPEVSRLTVYRWLLILYFLEIGLYVCKFRLE